MSREAWGRWGPADERGALNHIGADVVRGAAGLVRSGHVVSLAQLLSPRTPVPRHRAGVQHFMGRDGGDYAAGARRPGGFQFAEDTLVLPLHVGTHVDALCHAWCDDCLYNGFPGAGTRSTSGALHCGIDKMTPIVTRGVLLDVVRLHGGSVAPRASIGRDDLARAAQAAEVAIEPGDAVLIRTGWQETQAGSTDISFDEEPGIDVEAALWLAEAGAAMVGADNFAIEAIPFPAGTVFPVHQRLIRDYGIPLLEGLVLEPLAAHGRGRFLFMAAPLPVVGGPEVRSRRSRSCSAMSRLNGFLDGLRVIDVSAYLPGPFASLLLADMGADVVKVEPPQGEGMRGLGPRAADGTPLFHAALNAGKTVRRLDLKSADGKRDFLDLVDTADVLIEGFRPGAMDRLGLGCATLRARNRGLIFCSISGYGAGSPLARAAGHDANYLALAGVLHRNGSPPRFFDPPVADVTGSLFAALAILGAVQGRRRDGLGCHIDLAIADVAMPLQLFEIAALGETGNVPQPEGTYLNGGAAYYRVYATADARHVVLGAVEPKFWRSFCEAAGRPGWIARQTETLPQLDLIAELAAFFASLRLAECETRFAGADCCLSPVLDLAEALHGAHHRARGVVRTLPDRGLQALFPALVDGQPPAPRSSRTKERA